MKTISKLTLILLAAGILLIAGCSHNYYSGTGKGGKNCGCPSHKGMTGY